MKRKIILAFALTFILLGTSNAIDFTLTSSNETSLSSTEASLVNAKIATKELVTVAPKITGIFVQGNIIVPIGSITAAIISRVGDNLSQDKINDDSKSIYATGYFSDVSIGFSKTKKGTDVIFKVKENPVISGISIEGATAYKSDDLLSMLKSKKGDVLSYKNIQDGVKDIDEKYHKDGYMLERVVDVSVDPKTTFVKIKLIEGIIESIDLEGNDVTHDYVILRELKSKAGTVMNEQTLGKDLRKVFNLGFFADVSPDFEPGKNAENVILVLKIKEKKTNTINFGGGYGETEGLFGFVDLTADNLFGTGHGMLLRGQSGQTQQTYQFRYTYPWFLPDKLGDGVTCTFRKWLTIGQNIYLLDAVQNDGIYNGGDISFSKPISDQWSVSWSLGSEKVDPHGTSTFEAYLSDTVGISLSYDTRDNWMNPSTGQFDTFALRRGWNFMATSEGTNFTKNSVDLNQFIKVAEHQTLAAHIGVGVGLGAIPIGEIFYAGGANTIRGYNPDEARNGTKKIIANIEYRYTFNDMFQGVVFFDWGNAWNDGWPDPYAFISGKGFGIRLNTPMGPIRLDYGVGANRAFAEGVLHFSIGQAF